MPHDIFISHSSHNKAIADASCAALEATGVRCWIAPRDVTPGTEYGESIIGAIEVCRAMVLIFSRQANQSPHIRREVERALSKGKVILPFRIDDIVPTGAMEYALSSTHWLDALSPPIESRIDELVSVVNRLLKPQDTSENAAPRKQSVDLKQTTTREFESLFADRKDVIAEVEAEVSQACSELINKFEKLLLRLEMNLTNHISAPPRDSESTMDKHLERILDRIDKYDTELKETKCFLIASRQPSIPVDEWLQLLHIYQQATGGKGKVKDEIVAMGVSVFPLVCLAFRQMYSCCDHNNNLIGLKFTCFMEMELAQVMTRLKDSRALAFFAEAMIRHGYDLEGLNDWEWAAAIVRAVKSFVSDAVSVDRSFERLMGLSASTILRESHEKRERMMRTRQWS